MSVGFPFPNIALPLLQVSYSLDYWTNMTKLVAIKVLMERRTIQDVCPKWHHIPYTGHSMRVTLYLWFYTDDSIRMILYRWFYTGDSIPLILYGWFYTGDSIPVILYRWFYTGDSIRVILYRWFYMGDSIPVILYQWFYRTGPNWGLEFACNVL